MTCLVCINIDVSITIIRIIIITNSLLLLFIAILRIIVFTLLSLITAVG